MLIVVRLWEARLACLCVACSFSFLHSIPRAQGPFHSATPQLFLLLSIFQNSLSTKELMHYREYSHFQIYLYIDI